MMRYFFNLHECGTVVEDDDGRELRISMLPMPMRWLKPAPSCAPSWLRVDSVCHVISSLWMPLAKSFFGFLSARQSS